MRLPILLLPLLAACEPTPPPVTRVDSPPPASGALAGPVVELGIASRQVVPPDSSGRGMAIAGFRVTAFSQEGVGSPLRILVRAPGGEETGRRPEWGEAKQEIPASQYVPASDDREAIENQEWVAVYGAVPGLYMVLLLQSRAERYNLDLSVVRANGGKYQGGDWNLPATPGAIDTLWIEVTVQKDTVLVRRTGPPAQ